MNLNWNDLLNALALLLIFEGLLPFINPKKLKQIYAEFLSYPEKTLRLVGLASIIAGILILFLSD